MTIIKNYNHFYGRHWETGTVANYYAYRDIKAPHTSEPYSEALLLGISGGIVAGYFSFAYQGQDPHVFVLTRNTFDPLDTLFTRLGIVQYIEQTISPKRAEEKLMDVLDNGIPAVVWADTYSLPYNGLPHDESMWQIMPILVYGYDLEKHQVLIADRAEVSLSVNPKELMAGRSRIKKFKHRLLTLAPPIQEKLPAAVQQGITDCIKLFTENPPKGSKSNFGFAALQTWSKYLERPKSRQSWEKVFPSGRKMFNGLLSAFNSIALFGQDGILLDGDRKKYSEFLNEAAIILQKPGLKDAAKEFLKSSKAWKELAASLLPDDVDIFQKTRQLAVRKHRLFLEKGDQVTEELINLHNDLENVKTQMETDFPLDSAGIESHRKKISAAVMQVHDIEKIALDTLQAGLL